jgi:hypothetical protein
LRLPVLLLVTALGACRFDGSGTGATSPDGQDVPDVDAARQIDAGPLDPDAAPAPDAMPPVTAFCDPTDVTLIGCWRFEDAQAGDCTPDDGSSHGNDMDARDVLVGPGPSGHGQAMGFQSFSEAFVPDDASLEPAIAITIEAWVRPDSTNDTRSGVLDANARWAIFLSDTARPRCVVGNTSIEGLPIPLGTWTHVACTFDRLHLRLYVDGVEVNQVLSNVMLPPADGDGVHFGEDGPGGGDQLDGFIDDVRIFSIARTPEQLCRAAAPSCP